jgi:hypothetical protein
MGQHRPILATQLMCLSEGFKADYLTSSGIEQRLKDIFITPVGSRTNVNDHEKRRG